MKTKAVLVAFIIILSSSYCVAEPMYSLDEIREQAQNGWHQQYEAYNRTICIDVDINVPEVDTVPVLITRELFDEVVVSEMDDERSELYQDYTVSFSATGRCASIQSRYYTPDDRNLHKYSVYTEYSKPYAYDRVYARDSALSLQQAIDITQRLLDGFHLNEHVIWQMREPYRLRIKDFLDEKGEALCPGSYWIYYYQMLEGIPVYTHIGRCFKNWNTKTWHWCEPDMRACVIAENEIDIYFGNAITIQQVVENDIPLCSVGTVVDAVIEEIINGHIREVYELSLGYVMFEKPEESNRTWYAVPTWYVTCLYSTDARKEITIPENVFTVDSLAYVTLAINAQTGEMYQYTSNAKNRADYQGVVTWKDVIK